MKEIMVAYWSGTGNTAAMAAILGKGIQDGGATAKVVSVNVNEEIINEKGGIDYSKAELLSFAGNQYFVNNNVVGNRGIGVK